ncbi:rRNA maturation RNase YbeY [Myxococcota bacterium]|jgi:probable rRNA maturation factor|nr:rRNA maturation RNase YbeY [Myxococcota bacterium]
MPVLLLNRQRKVSFDARAILPLMERALEQAGVPDGEVSLVLLSDAGIRRMNRLFRSRDEATDVLSFPAREGPGGEFAGPELGDVLISLERVQAAGPVHVPEVPPERAMEEEVLFLFLHGLLHLLGHDHQDPGQTRRMDAAHRRIWKALHQDGTTRSRTATFRP